MTLQNLYDALALLPAETSIAFQPPGGPVCARFHVTEVRRAHIDSVDCAGAKDAWTEMQMQVLDSPGQMQAGKLRAIVYKLLQSFEGARTAPLVVEFAPGNVGLQLYTLGAGRSVAGAHVFALHPKGAACKPALRLGARWPAASAETSSPPRCCG